MLTTAIVAAAILCQAPRSKPVKSPAKPANTVLHCYVDASESAMTPADISAATARARDIWLSTGIDWQFIQDSTVRFHAVVRLCKDLPHYGMSLGPEAVVRDGEDSDFRWCFEVEDVVGEALYREPAHW